MVDIIFDLLVIYLVIMAVFNGLSMYFAMMLARSSFADPTFTTPVTQEYPPGAFKAFLKEFWTTSILYLSWPLGLVDRDNEHNRHTTDELPPVLFIHGWTENRIHWRNLIHHLKGERKRRLFTINLHPVDAKLSAYREQLAARIERILSESKHDRICLVAHSMGGIIARSYMKEHGQTKIERLITIGSPHKGTILGFGALALVAEQLRPHSDFLAHLEDGEDLSNVDVHCISTVHDNIAAPFQNDWLDQATNHLVYGVGHVGMLTDPQVRRILRTLLFSTEAEMEPVKERVAQAMQTLEKTARAKAEKEAGKKEDKKTAGKAAPKKKSAAQKNDASAEEKPKARRGRPKKKPEAEKEQAKALKETRKTDASPQTDDKDSAKLAEAKEQAKSDLTARLKEK